MGWAVVGFGNIDVDEEHMAEIIGLMIGDKKEVIDRLTDNQGCDFDEVEGTNGTITFKMWGNKGIDYEKLDTLKSYCKEKDISIEINVNEYIESFEGGGYYYNSTEVGEE